MKKMILLIAAVCCAAGAGAANFQSDAWQAQRDLDAAESNLKKEVGADKNYSFYNEIQTYFGYNTHAFGYFYDNLRAVTDTVESMAGGRTAFNSSALDRQKVLLKQYAAILNDGKNQQNVRLIPEKKKYDSLTQYNAVILNSKNIFQAQIDYLNQEIARIEQESSR